MGRARDVIKKIKHTRAGAAAAWLAKPGKHYRDIECHLALRLPQPPTRQQIRWCFWDFFRFQLKYRGDLETDYFGAQLYRKSDFVRRDSMAHAVRFSWRDAVQEKSCHEIFLDKRAFYAAFSEYLGRRWLVVDADTRWEDFRDFVDGCGGAFFAKTPRGMGGKGVALHRAAGGEECRALFDLCRKRPAVLEEVLTQCQELRVFSPGTVNTLRVITIIDESGRVHIARCELRMGRSGMDVDNYSSGGLVAQVDAQSGIVYSMGRDGNGREYLFHPDSGRQIVGFTIPDWEQYKNFARKLAEKYPGMRYVGWDIVKDSKGNFCVIEGNKDAGVGGLESGLLYGLKPYYDALLRGEASYPHHQ